VEGIFAEAARKSFGEGFAVFKDGLTSKVKSGAQAVATGAQTLGSSAVSKADAISKSEAFGNLKDGMGKGADVAAELFRDAAGKVSRLATAFSTRLTK
jgi:hypothetical protein